MHAFGQVLLSTRPEKSVGTDAIWQQAETALQDALNDMGWNFALNEADGAFYGEPCQALCGLLLYVGLLGQGTEPYHGWLVVNAC